jgi:signal transduction histidine kinase
VTIYNQIAEQSAKLLGCPAASVFRWDEERREAAVITDYGTANQSTGGLHMLLSESGILLDLVTNRSPIAVEDAQADPLVSSLWREKLNVRALLCLPVWGKGKPLGFLCMIEPHEPRRWKANEIQLVDSFVNRAAVALENANLHKQLEWAAALEERQRIAADMHDGLAQTLSYMGHKVDQVTELAEAGRIPDLLDTCSHIRDTLDRATGEVRQSIASLQETPLPKRPLQDWLAEIANEFTKRSDGKTAAALVSKLSAPLFLPPSHMEQVLNVVQEAITNAGRHAGARQIVITLERKSDRAVVAVEDDGQGFDPGSPPTDGHDHFGLSIMHARAARIDGQLAVDSSPEQGTRVTLTWPLESS